MRRFSASHDEVSEALSRALEERAGREKAIQALERQRRMDALGRLSGGIAHDVNNALVVVVANTTALLEEETDPDQRQVLRDMLTAARSAGETVQQLMIFSQRAPSNAPADTAQVVTQLARSLRRVFPENIHITVTATGPLWVTLPVAALERVLLNLSLNARDAMPMGGELSIQAHPHEPGQIAIVVGDTGLGMTEAVQKRAFEPFFTTKTELKGTGLGLSSVQEIVVKAGGTIALESALGEGTRVTLHLPQTAGPPTKDAEPTAQRDGAKIHILLVEDEPAVRKATGRMLELIGHSFVAARDERTAMLAMDVSGVPFDLMLTDGVMPQTNTDQLIQGFRERFPQAGVVLYSGWLSQSTITADEHVIFMAKPFSMTQLEDAITQAIQPR
ncbi:MAG: ATP-binding protein, partial [Myxococcota bacterium]